MGDWRSNRLNDLKMARMIGGERMNRNLRNQRNQISCSSTAEIAVERLKTRKKKNRREETALSDNVIDEWMRDSVVEIVQNLRDAPLLVHVYSDGDTGGKRLKTEKAEAGDWMMMRTGWENGTAKKPEGVIFVEQLRKDVDVGGDEETSSFGEGSEVTRAWGVVVQSRGENCGPACYLLKTSRAGGGSGLGLCCTHFCLVRVKSFRETAEAQFIKSWLLNGI